MLDDYCGLSCFAMQLFFNISERTFQTVYLESKSKKDTSMQRAYSKEETWTNFFKFLLFKPQL